MELYDKLGIKYKLLKDMINIFSEYKNIDKVVVFGSRARGDFKYNSDIDVAIYGENLTQREFNMVEDKIRTLNTVLDFDIVHFQSLIKQVVKENIEKDGVEVYVRG